MEHLQMLLEQDPTLLQRMQQIESHTQNFVSTPHGSARSAAVTIPVVVHVVYRTGSENISDAQVQSQIAVLNEDFRRLNADAMNTLSQFL